MNINEIGEFGLISQISSKFSDIIPTGCSGIGDDCAIIPISDSRSMVITTDMLIEDIHFLRNAIPAYDLGSKSLAVNLSDLAAMGATAHSSFLSIALPSDVSVEWCNEFFEGYRSHNVALLGGDTTKATDRISINITAIGMVDNDKIKMRSGARVGDKIYVTSTLGDSAAGLRAILDGRAANFPELVMAHNHPTPHLREGILLGSLTAVHSMMDVSDGIASDLKHILRASGVGAKIELSQIPMSDALIASPWNALELALTGGEDYCLLFTASADIQFDDYYHIGTITRQHIGEIEWLDNSKPKLLMLKGFTHF